MKHKEFIIKLTLILILIFISIFFSYKNENLLKDHKPSTSSNAPIEINFSDPYLSDVLTFDEITKKIAERNNVSLKEAEKQVESSFSNKDVSSVSINPLPISATYRIISSTFHISNNYSPVLELYCQTNEESKNLKSIEKILNVSINNTSNTMCKKFNGNIYANLEDDKRIYWIIDGDFYDSGSSSINKINNASLKSISMNFVLSSPSNHYKYIYKTGYFTFN